MWKWGGFAGFPEMLPKCINDRGPMLYFAAKTSCIAAISGMFTNCNSALNCARKGPPPAGLSLPGLPAEEQPAQAGS